MSSSLPPVAVVIPLHNGARWIQSTLAAVQAQSHPPVEIVVVDDGSTDEGPALAAAVDGVTVRPLARPSVRGAGPGRQCGFEQTTAPLVAFLDQDDLWHPDHLRLLARLLADRPDCPAAVASIRDFHDGTPPDYDAPRRAPSPFDPWSSFPFNGIRTPSGVLVRRAALAALGGWPTDAAVTDFVVWFHLSLDGPLVVNRCVTCAKRSHASSKLGEIQRAGRISFIPEKVRQLDALCAARGRRRPEQADQLRTRLDALRAGGRLAAAYDANRGHLVSAAAPALEALAETEPAVLDDLFSFVFLFLLGRGLQSSVAAKRAVLDTFLLSWPDSAPRSRRRLRALFLQEFPARFFLDFLRRNPFRLLRWQLALASTAQALRRRWTRRRGRQP